MTPPARIAAAITLLEAISAAAGRPADAVAHDFFRARRFIGGGDRRDVSDRVWAVLRAERRLLWWLEHLHLPAEPRLLIAASLVLEGTKAAQLAGIFSGGRYAPEPLPDFAQAALRRLEGASLLHPAMPEAVRLELPDWLLAPLRARFGDMLEAEMAALGGSAPVDLRVNLLRADRASAQAALAAEGLETSLTPLSPWGLRLAGRAAITACAAYREGLVEIQDEGSQLVAALADARPGMNVLDLCAGAGGKTLALAMCMENRGRIAACDVSAARLTGATRRLRRAGVHNVETHQLVAGDRWAKRRAGQFDRVLVDAPCTGTGTWRRNPDGRLRLTERDLSELVVMQAKLLDQAAELVRPGGRLVYATCSVLSAENEAQMVAFLDRHGGFIPISLAEAWGRTDDAPPLRGDYLALTPRQHGTDGFFAAMVERPA